VAALIDTAQVSGPGRQLAALATGLAAEGVDVLVVMFHRAGQPPPPYAAYLTHHGVRHAVLPDHGPLDTGIAARVAAALADFAPDVVQTHSYRTTAVAFLLRRRGARWPWIAFFHGATTENLKVRLYHWLDRRLMASADRLVVMSRAHLAGFASLGARVRVLHNAVIPLPDEGAPADVAPLRAVDADGRPAPLLGVVGRLSSEKGVDLFLDACAALARRGVAFSAVIAGDGPDRAALEARRDQLGLAARVHFLGAVRAVASLYPQLDLVVLPSRSEGLPNVLLEALRLDVPVVATRVGAVPEVLVDGSDAGIVVPPLRADLLADAVMQALATGRSAAARAARAEVAERFSLARRVREHVRLYDEVAPRTAEVAA
jgi:glycosyltransferase involved in cell wall biosynthesis